MEDYQDDPDSQFELGVELMTQQIEELIQSGAPASTSTRSTDRR